MSADDAYKAPYVSDDVIKKKDMAQIISEFNEKSCPLVQFHKPSLWPGWVLLR